MIFTVTYLNKHTRTHEIAGYENSLRAAKKLARCFASEPRLVNHPDDVVIWNGTPGGLRITKQ